MSDRHIRPLRIPLSVLLIVLALMAVAASASRVPVATASSASASPRECAEYGQTTVALNLQVESACPGRGEFLAGLYCSSHGLLWDAHTSNRSGSPPYFDGDSFSWSKARTKIFVVNDQSGKSRSYTAPAWAKGTFVHGQFVGTAYFGGATCGTEHRIVARYQGPSHFAPAP